jgi:flagellar capping protein FliD
MADGANSTIVKEGLIHLSADVAPVPTAETVPAAAEVAPVPAPAAREITLDDELVELMVEKVTGHPKFTEAINSVTQSNTALAEQITALSKSVSDFQASFVTQKKTLEDRMVKLEKPIAEHVQQVIDDLPAATGQKVVIHRPRVSQQAAEDEKPRYSDIAQETLAKFGN